MSSIVIFKQSAPEPVAIGAGDAGQAARAELASMRALVKRLRAIDRHLGRFEGLIARQPDGALCRILRGRIIEQRAEIHRLFRACL